MMHRAKDGQILGLGLNVEQRQVYALGSVRELEVLAACHGETPMNATHPPPQGAFALVRPRGNSHMPTFRFSAALLRQPCKWLILQQGHIASCIFSELPYLLPKLTFEHSLRSRLRFWEPRCARIDMSSFAEPPKRLRR